MNSHDTIESIRAIVQQNVKQEEMRNDYIFRCLGTTNQKVCTETFLNEEDKRSYNDAFAKLVSDLSFLKGEQVSDNDALKNLASHVYENDFSFSDYMPILVALQKYLSSLN